MAQLLRVCPWKIYRAIVRCHSSQRYQQNYYEILNVSPDASQKDIKLAFIRLSKQLHPDISGKHSHIDFVKLNEAYSVLGKKSTREEYDLTLKCDRYNPSYARTVQNRRYASRWEYEVRTAGGPWPPPNVKSHPYRGLILALIIFGIGLSQIFFVFHAWKARKRTMLRNEQLTLQYQQIRERALAKTNESIIEDIDPKNHERLDRSNR